MGDYMTSQPLLSTAVLDGKPSPLTSPLLPMPSTPGAAPASPTHTAVTTEGATLHYEYFGSGPLLILIPGAGAQSLQYSYILPHLARAGFTAVTYDRRGMGMSLLLSAGNDITTTATGGSKDDALVPAPIPSPGPLNPTQHARDVLAIMRAMNRTRTSIFGNSAGATLALELAASYPEHLDHVVIHEPSITHLLPDRAALLDRIFACHDIYKRQGHLAASHALQTAWMPVYARTPPLAEARDEDMENFWKHEWLSIMLYCPELGHVVRNDVSCIVGVGKDSDEAAPFKRTGPLLAERLGCECVEFPGHHSGFENEAEEFAKVLAREMEGMEEKRGGMLKN